MRPSMLLRMVGLSLLMVPSLAASRDVITVGVSAAQQPAPAKPDDGAWPPAGVSRPSKDGGVTLPRLLHEVRPQYTADAMREKIQGKVALECVVETDGTVERVHVVRSLDTFFGLDDQAIKAAKQWRFAPGMKDSVAVSVLITIDLTFTLDGAPRSLTWPEGFPSSGDTAIDISQWTEDVSDVSGLQIRIAYPRSWMLRKDGPATRLLLLQSAGGRGTRIFFIERPKPAQFQIGPGVTPEMLQRMADGAKQRVTASGRGGELSGVGEARAADRFWLWFDTRMATLDVANLPPGLGLLSQAAFDGARLWTFITTAGSQEVPVGCVVMYRRNTSDTEKQQELQQATVEFAAMLQHLSIS